MMAFPKAETCSKQQSQRDVIDKNKIFFSYCIQRSFYSFFKVAQICYCPEQKIFARLDDCMAL
jgi:hypothetical protein